MTGGDNILAKIKSDNIHAVINVVKHCNNDELSFVIGIGACSTDAYIALKYSKANNYTVTKYNGRLFSIVD